MPIWVLVALCAASLIAIGCGATSSAPTTRHDARVKVDASAGSVGGLRLGESPARAGHLFGRGRSVADEPTGLPAGTDTDQIGVPPTYAFPQPCASRRRISHDSTPRAIGVLETSYANIGVSYCDARAFVIVASSPGASTTLGVHIGDRSQQPAARIQHCAAADQPATPSRRYRYSGTAPRTLGRTNISGWDRTRSAASPWRPSACAHDPDQSGISVRTHLARRRAPMIS